MAHAMGKDIVLITQNMDDVPFDLRHLEAVRYHPNGEGLEKLRVGVRSFLQQLLGAYLHRAARAN